MRRIPQSNNGDYWDNLSASLYEQFFGDADRINEIYRDHYGTSYQSYLTHHHSENGYMGQSTGGLYSDNGQENILKEEESVSGYLAGDKGVDDIEISLVKGNRRGNKPHHNTNEQMSLMVQYIIGKSKGLLEGLISKVWSYMQNTLSSERNGESAIGDTSSKDEHFFSVHPAPLEV